MATIDIPPPRLSSELVPPATLSDDQDGGEQEELKIGARVDHLEEFPDSKDETSRILRSNYADWSRGRLVRKFWLMYAYGLLVATSGLFAGYIDTAPGSVVANKSFIKQFGTVHDPKTGKLALNADYVSYWGLAQQVSTLFPQVLTPIATDRYGRKVGNWLYLGFACISIVLEIVARNWKVWLVARFFAGLTFGFIQGGPLTLMSEMVFPQMRGNVLACFSLNWGLGTLFCSIGLQILNTVAPTHYRNILYSEWLLVVLFGVACVVTPESPAWLIKMNRHEKAKAAFRRLIGKMDDVDYEHEFQVIVQEVEYSQKLVAQQSRSEWRAVFKWRNFRRVLIPVLPYAGQSLNGGAYISSYTTYFFQQAGLSNAFLASVITSILGSFGIACAMLLYDRIGRRPLMVWGTIGCIIGNFLIGGLAFLPINSAVGAGLITSAAFYTFVSSISYGAVGWSAQVEITTPLLRAKSAGMMALIHGASKILWNYTTPQMLSDQKANWGAKCGLLFGGLTTLWFIPVYLYYPETKHRSFAAIDDLFERKIPERKFHVTPTPYDSPDFIESMHKRRTWKQFLAG